MDNTMTKKRELAKIHAKTYYLKNRENILAKKKAYYLKIKAEKPQVESNITEEQTLGKTEEPIINKKNKKTKTIFTAEYILDKLNELDINQSTRKKYIHDFKTLIKITSCTDFVSCLKDHKNLISLIQNGMQLTDQTQKYSLNTQKSLFQTIIYLITKLGLPISAAKQKIYQNIFEIYKIKSSDLSEDKTTNLLNSVISYDEYILKIKTKFGENSKEYLIAKLYDQITVRDDFHNLIIKSDDTNLSDDNNYIIINNKKAKIILNNFKTKEKYKSITYTVSSVLDKLIKNFIKNNKIAYNDSLFGKSLLSKFIGKMNKAVDVEGAVNTLRHIKVSSEINKITDPEKRQELASKMLHSPITQQKYLRLLK